MITVDLHCDTVFALYESGRCDLRRSGRCIDLVKLQKCGSLVQCFALHDKKEKYHYGYERLKHFIAFFDGLVKKHRLNQVFSFADIKAGAQNVLLTLEDCGAVMGLHARIDALYAAGARMAAPIWNDENCFGTPNAPRPQPYGLTPFGFEAIEHFEHSGVIVDVSHMSDEAFWDVCAAAKKPFIASHSNARAVCAHPRNLTDEMLRALADSGGVCGLNFYPVFVAGDSTCTAAQVAAHAAHIKKTAGCEALAIGSDFDGFEGAGEIRDISQLHLLEKALKESGFSDSEIEKVFYKNALRVFETLLA